MADADNCIRLLLLNFDGINPTLRETFLQFLRKNTNKSVSEFLQLFKSELTDYESKLTKADIDKLFPSIGITRLEEWDISLISYILLNCCSLKRLFSCLLSLFKKDSMYKSHKKNLKSFIFANKTQIHQLMTTGQITSEQYDIVTTNETTGKWDTALLIRVIQHLCSKQTSQKMCFELKNALNKEVELCTAQNDLNEFLQVHVTEFKGMLQRKEISELQYNQLYPPNKGLATMTNWENDVLINVVLKVCNEFSAETVEAIKAVRESRNMICHLSTPDISQHIFLKWWTKTTNAINVLIQNEIPHKQQEIQASISKLFQSKFDQAKALKRLNDCCDEHIDILKTLKEVEAKVDNLDYEVKCLYSITEQHDTELQDMKAHIEELAKAIEGIKTHNIPEYNNVNDFNFTLELSVRSTDTNASKTMIDILFRRMTGETDEHGTGKRIIGILTATGCEVVEVGKESILIKMKCNTLKLLLKFLKYVHIRDMQSAFDKIAAGLIQETGIDFHLVCIISSSSLMKLKKDIDRIKAKDSGYQQGRYIKVNLRPHNPVELFETFNSVNGGDIKTSLENISRDLTETFGTEVSIVAKLDIATFENALNKTEKMLKESPGQAEGGILENVDERNSETVHERNIQPVVGTLVSNTMGATTVGNIPIITPQEMQRLIGSATIDMEQGCMVVRKKNNCAP